MPNLTAVFSLVDRMSDAIANVSQAGMSMVEQFEQAGDTASGAFDGIVSSATTTASSVDGVATSLTSYSTSASDAADQTDYWTDAIGNYDKSALEAIYTTEELVEMGYKTQEALESEQTAAQEAEEALDKMAEQSEETGQAQEEMGDKGTSAVNSIASALAAAGITATIKEISEAAYELVDAYSEAEKVVVNATGATGAALDSLGSSMLEAYAGNDDSLQDAAGAIGEINTRMGLTGDALTEVTGKFLDFADITGTNVVGSVQNVTKVMNQWGVEGQDVEKVLDRLAYAGQISGASVDTLSNTLVTGAASFQQAGLSLDSTIQMLADFELAGINSTTAITAMRTAVTGFSKDGKDAGTALQEVIAEIAGMENAADATALAVETFGSRAGQQLASAIRSGTVSVDTFSATLEEADGTLAKTAEAGESLSEKWQKASNNISTAFTKALQPSLDKVSSGFANVMNGVGDFLNEHPTLTKAIVAVGVGIGTVSAGIAAVSFATTVAIPAITTFGVALNDALGPVGWVAIGLTALVAAGAAFIAMMEDAEDETAGMTAVTRNQYYELQDLNAEYEEACEKYGETSEEASRLKYQVDDLSAAFEASRQTVEEFTAEVDALCESVDKLWSEYHNGMDDIRTQELGALSLIQKYEDLATQANLTGAQEKELEAVTKRLAESYPDLAARLEKTSGSAVDYAEAMRQACEQQAEQQRMEQAQDTYVEALLKREELTEELAKAQANYNAELEANNIIDNGDGTYSGEWATAWKTNIKECQEAIDELNASIAENEAGISEIEQYWGKLTEAEEAAAEVPPTYEEAVAAAIESTKERIDELCAAYDEVYQSALASMEGQFGLFDQASMESEEYMNATVANAQAALDSQLAYWNNYQANIEVLKSTSAADLGITQENYEALMAYAQGGTEEAAGLSASMAEAINSGNTEAVAELANTVGEVSAKQQEIAASTADWVTDFTSQMDEIEREMQATVEGMNLSDEAAASATATINAYVSSIRNSKGAAVAAAREVATAVAAALQTQAALNLRVNTSGTVPGHANGTRNAENAFVAGEDGPELIIRKVDAFANGTTESPNAFIAGDDGPELILGQQGSTVFPTEETDRLINALNNRPEPSPILMESRGDSGGRQSAGEQTKRIFLEISGSGRMEVGGSGGADKNTILDVLMDNAKSVFMNILQEEVFEEGDMAYDY